MNSRIQKKVFELRGKARTTNRVDLSVPLTLVSAIFVHVIIVIIIISGLLIVIIVIKVLFCCLQA